MAFGRSRVIVASLVLLAVGGCEPQSAAPVSARLPDLVGLRLDEARDKLDKANFERVAMRDASQADRTPVIDSNWTVCRQQPSPGTMPKTTRIVLHVVKNDEACGTPAQGVKPLASGSPSSAPSIGPATPTVEKRIVRETVALPFGEQSVDDPTLPRGSRTVRVAGVNGVKTLTYEVTFVGGVQTDRKLVSDVVTRPPVTQVVAVGTKQESRCDPNYSGACVPIAADVDCAGGSGNGPAYVRGPVRVVGTDIYDLDRDGDGIGCEQE